MVDKRTMVDKRIGSFEDLHDAVDALQKGSCLWVGAGLSWEVAGSGEQPLCDR